MKLKPTSSSRCPRSVRYNEPSSLFTCLNSCGKTNSATSHEEHSATSLGFSVGQDSQAVSILFLTLFHDEELRRRTLVTAKEVSRVASLMKLQVEAARSRATGESNLSQSPAAGAVRGYSRAPAPWSSQRRQAALRSSGSHSQSSRRSVALPAVLSRAARAPAAGYQGAKADSSAPYT